MTMSMLGICCFLVRTPLASYTSLFGPHPRPSRVPSPGPRSIAKRLLRSATPVMSNVAVGRTMATTQTNADIARVVARQAAEFPELVEFAGIVTTEVDTVEEVRGSPPTWAKSVQAASQLGGTYGLLICL